MRRVPLIKYFPTSTTPRNVDHQASREIRDCKNPEKMMSHTKRDTSNQLLQHQNHKRKKKNNGIHFYFTQIFYNYKFRPNCFYVCPKNEPNIVLGPQSTMSNVNHANDRKAALIGQLITLLMIFCSSKVFSSVFFNQLSPVGTLFNMMSPSAPSSYTAGLLKNRSKIAKRNQLACSKSNDTNFLK